jgi:hypothetical protein
VLPNFVIIGAQKAGSTFFVSCLADHPDVYMPPYEVRFFEDPDYGDGDPRVLEALFRGVIQETALGIKRPGYLSRPEVAERIHRHIPEARLIAILRDPVDRAISAYFHLMRTGFLPVRPLEDGMTRILDDAYRSLHPRAAEVVEFGFYHRHLTRFLEYFDRRRMLILPFETIEADPRGAIGQAYRFLGVRDDHVPPSLTRRDRRNSGVYSLPRLRVLNLSNPFLYAYDEGRSRRVPRSRPSLLGRGIRRVVDTTDRRVLARLYGGATPEASPALRQRLYRLYADDIERLERLLDRQLAEWRPERESSPAS